MSAAAVLSICLSNALAANAQSTGDKQAPVTNSERLPMSHARKPKLSLENALAIAKSQLKNPSEISSYWLYGARFILYGDSTLPDKDKAPCWHFTWLSDDFGQAAIEVVVFMDGNSMRLPTL
jgi:hypothetical protein